MDYYIYKLVCKDPLITEVYVGSTKNPKQRIQCHKTRCNNPNNKSYNFMVYKFIRDNGGWENWEFIIIETIFCNNKKEALINEHKYILELNATLNKVLPTRTHADSVKHYEETHKEQRKLYFKQYSEINKEKIKQYRETHKEQSKHYAAIYYDQNKDALKNYGKQYYQQQKSK